MDASLRELILLLRSEGISTSKNSDDVALNDSIIIDAFSYKFIVLGENIKSIVKSYFSTERYNKKLIKKLVENVIITEGEYDVLLHFISLRNSLAHSNIHNYMLNKLLIPYELIIFSVQFTDDLIDKIVKLENSKFSDKVNLNKSDSF